MAEIIELTQDRRVVHDIRRRRRQKKKLPVLGDAERCLLATVIDGLSPEENAELDRIHALADDPKYR